MTLKVTYNTFPYHLAKQPHILDNSDFLIIQRQLNREQARIVKNILTKKKHEPNKPLCLFITGSARTRKTFTAKAIFQSLIHFYNDEMNYDPEQIKWIITAYIGKSTFNTGDATLHYAFYMPFNKLEYFPLNSEKMDTLTKLFHQL